MWLHTTLGFFSLTRVPGQPELFQLRSRVRRDLDLFVAHCINVGKTVDASPEAVANRDVLEQIIYREPPADYRWRIIFPEVHIPLVMTILMKTVTYDNFKGEIARTPSQVDKLSELHAIWSITRMWTGRERVPGKPPQAPAAGPRVIHTPEPPPTGQRRASTLPPGGQGLPRPKAKRRPGFANQPVHACEVCGEPDHHGSHCPILRAETGGTE